MPALAWMLLIFAGSTDVLSAEHTSRFLVPFLRWLDPAITIQQIATAHFFVRKLGHVTEYAVLAALLWRGLRATFVARTNAAIAWFTFAIAAAFAFSDEFHQTFTPSRTASSRDVLIDCAGAFFAVTLCWMLTRRDVARLAVAPSSARD